jgi:hypothetical protein
MGRKVGIQARWVSQHTLWIMEVPLPEQHSVFFSYSHRDRENASSLASYLGRLGLKIWLSPEEIDGGQSIIEAISNAIQQSDLYVVCLSPAAIGSQSVVDELKTALTLETTSGQPKVMPVLVAHTDIPSMLAGRPYFDMTESLDQTKPKIRQSIESQLNVRLPVEAAATAAQRQILISSIRLQLVEVTKRQTGGAEHSFVERKVLEEARQKMQLLRRRANGILLNFISPLEIDFSSKFLQFPNGCVTGHIEDKDGAVEGSIKKKAIVEVQVLNPKGDKLNELVPSKLSRLGVNRATYVFAISPPILGFPLRTLAKLQQRYVILGWDRDRGVDIELPDDLQVSVWCSDEQIALALETKYAFEMDSATENFSVREFIDWILADSNSI